MPTRLSELVDFLEGAMEAEDITTQARETAAADLGGNSTTGTTQGGDTTNATNDDGSPVERDESKTSDIFGTQGTDPEGGNSTEGDDTPDEGDDTGDTDTGDDNPFDDEGEAKEKQPYHDRGKLKAGMLELYRLLKGNRDALTELMSRLADPGSIDACTKVVSNLDAASQVLFRDLTEDFEKAEFESLFRDYVTVKRVFDISIEMLGEQLKAKLPKRKKNNAKANKRKASSTRKPAAKAAGTINNSVKFQKK